MPIVLLIRHGETDYVKKGRLAGRLPEIHLNKQGLEQAQGLAQALTSRLDSRPLKGVYSSPLERTMETAAPIAQALGLPLIPRLGLIETGIGEWQGSTIKSLRRSKQWKMVQALPSRFQFPGGESFADSQVRICSEIRELAAGCDAKDILVCVSHADPIRLATAYYLGLSLDHFQRLTVAPASITALHFSDMSSRLLFANYGLSFTLPKD